MGEMNEANKGDIDALFEALPLDWETAPPAPAPPIPTIREPLLYFAHTILQGLECLRAKKI